ncbi:MAG: hypothetical protein KIT48_09370 [Pseudolabrys sp.]|nr:hypothetical protein [Pseudolabrys sp.]
MPRNDTTGVFVRVSNSFSNPVFGTVIDPIGANELFDDYDTGLTNSIPKEPTSAAGGGTIPVSATDATLAVTGSALTHTTLTLPSVAARDGLPLHIVDWSTSVTDHEIEITPDGAETIMNLSTWSIFSNASQSAGITLYPSTTLGGWYYAP